MKGQQPTTAMKVVMAAQPMTENLMMAMTRDGNDQRLQQPTTAMEASNELLMQNVIVYLASVACFLDIR